MAHCVNGLALIEPVYTPRGINCEIPLVSWSPRDARDPDPDGRGIKDLSIARLHGDSERVFIISP